MEKCKIKGCEELALMHLQLVNDENQEVQTLCAVHLLSFSMQFVALCSQKIAKEQLEDIQLLMAENKLKS
jgi:hypothetical protein